MATERVQKYIAFRAVVQNEHTKKTRVWDVWNKKDGSSIGTVKWYYGFRKYVFHPADDTFYDHDGLRFIADFCENQTKEHYFLAGRGIVVTKATA